MIVCTSLKCSKIVCWRSCLTFKIINNIQMNKILNYSVLMIFFILILNSVVFSQIMNYAVSEIPDSLKEHAEAVIRFKQEDITIENIKKTKYKLKEVISILKKSGEGHAFIVAPYDKKLIKFVSLSGKYYDKKGKLLKIVKKKDIKDISYYQGLFSDNRVKYVENPPFTPPYTVEYEYELEFLGMPEITDWMPISAYNVSLETAFLNVYSPIEYKYRIKEKNFEGKKTEDNKNKFHCRTWQLNNIKAVLPEQYNYSISNLVPEVLLVPSDFLVEGFKGNMDTWQNFGKWIYKLNQDRDELPEETILKIQDLIKNIPDDKAKAKAVYEYMQNKTRYVSIQLGIGGWQPFEASYTDRNGYGDCKALSYYMQSLLKAAGINSYYTIVKAGDDAKEIDTDFPSQQFNHAILCLPLKNDTTWLECTDQKIPFGYISDFTDDRNVLIVTKDGGKLIHTKVYSENTNSLNRKAEINLFKNGNINAEIHSDYKGLQYDFISQMPDLPDDKKLKKIKKNISLSGLSVNSFRYRNDKNIIPSAEEYLKIEVKNYASVSSGRLFLNPNLLNRRTYVPKKLTKRKSNIKLKFAYTDTDTLIYDLPEDLKTEFIPDNISKKTKYGNYAANFILENNKLMYVRKLIMHKGTFPASDYNNLRIFFKFIVSSDKQTCVFKFTE